VKKIFSSRLFWGCSAGTIALVVVVTLGITMRGSDATSNKKVSVSTSTSTSSTTSTTTTTTLPHPLIQPAAANLPMLGAGVTLGSGSHNPNVALYEQRLADLKFDPGTVNTTYDSKTVFAVQTLQKLKGLPVTGRIGDAEITTLNSFQYDQAWASSDEADHFDVSLDKQVGILWNGFQPKLITTVSTGGGYHYCYNSVRSGKRLCSTAVTPTGKYAFTWRYKGWRKSDLGHLYNPVYFNGGIAVHGYTSVPTHAASHGCVRIPMYVAEYFPSLVVHGETVNVVGSTPVSASKDTVHDIATTTTTTVAPTTTTTPSTTSSTTTTLPTTTTTTH
jgi:hypothetical protein